MKFRNAYNGISLLFYAELVVIAAAVLGAFSYFNISILALLIGLAVIAAAIMALVGYFKAAKDDADFKRALICVLVSLVVSAIATMVKTEGLLKDLLALISLVLQQLTTIFAILGITSLSKAVGNKKNVKFGKLILKIIYVTFVVSIGIAVLLQIISFPNEIKNLLSIASSLVAVVTYIMFVLYLRKAQVMLKNQG